MSIFEELHRGPILGSWEDYNDLLSKLEVLM